jgi:hypothetical protein
MSESERERKKLARFGDIKKNSVFCLQIEKKKKFAFVAR